jgi:hypothetical protein
MDLAEFRGRRCHLRLSSDLQLGVHLDVEYLRHSSCLGRRAFGGFRRRSTSSLLPSLPPPPPPLLYGRPMRPFSMLFLPSFLPVLSFNAPWAGLRATLALSLTNLTSRYHQSPMQSPLSVVIKKKLLLWLVEDPRDLT